MARRQDDGIGAVWDDIENALGALKAPINAAIRAYPLPIPGCDAQYNYLLEQRSQIAAAMARLAKARDAGDDIGTFLDGCEILDDARKAALRRRLPSPLRKAG